MNAGAFQFGPDFSADPRISTDASDAAVGVARAVVMVTLSAYTLLYVLSPMNIRPACKIGFVEFLSQWK
jgi:hypothetical protein